MLSSSSTINILVILHLTQWEYDYNPSPSFRFAFNFYIPVMALDDAFCNRKPETASPCIFIAGGILPVEWLEYFEECIMGDPSAVVADQYLGESVCSTDLDTDSMFFMFPVFDAVIQYVHNLVRFITLLTCMPP